MLHVEHFGFHALLGDVFKHDLASDATLGSGEGGGGANGTGTNNSKLRGLNGSFRMMDEPLFKGGLLMNGRPCN